MLKSKEVFHHLIHVGFGTRMHERRKDQSQTHDVYFAMGISNLLYYQTTFYLSVICFSNIAEYGTFHGVKIKNRIRLGLERKKKDHCRQHLF